MSQFVVEVALRTRPLALLTISLVVVVVLKAKDNNKIILPDYVLSAKTVAVIVDPNEMGVPPALPGRHAKFDRSGSPSKKLLA